jgi:hypothetical protein
MRAAFANVKRAGKHLATASFVMLLLLPLAQLVHALRHCIVLYDAWQLLCAAGSQTECQLFNLLRNMSARGVYLLLSFADVGVCIKVCQSQMNAVAANPHCRITSDVQHFGSCCT